MMLGFNKRGQEVLQLTLLFEILIGIAVSLILLNSLYLNIYQHKENLQEDFRMLNTTVSFLPGNLELEYPIGRFEYSNGKFIEPRSLDKYLGKKSHVKIVKENGEIRYE